MQHLREICAAAGTDQSGASLAQVLRWRTCDLMLLREFYGPSGSLVVAVIRPAHARTPCALILTCHVRPVVGELAVGAAIDGEIMELDADVEHELQARCVLGGLQAAVVGPLQDEVAFC